MDLTPISESIPPMILPAQGREAAIFSAVGENFFASSSKCDNGFVSSAMLR